MSRESKATKEEIQRNRDEAYQNGWSDGYAEGYGKATDAALPPAQPDAVEALAKAAEKAALRLEWVSGILHVEQNRDETWQLARDLRAALAAIRAGGKP
jgi:hypothetical protein